MDFQSFIRHWGTSLDHLFRNVISAVQEKKAYKRQQAEKAYQANGQDLGSRMMAASPQLYMELERMRRGKGPKR